MSSSPRPIRFRTRAFSMIEVLISIVVLALGLLGLAAVFPVVINQQRQASDAVQGISIERSITDYIENSAMLREEMPAPLNPANPNDRRGWRVLLAEPFWSDKGDWYIPDISIDPLTAVGMRIDPNLGYLALGEGPGHTVYIPLAERLSPAAYSTGSDPRFVWDMAARRIEAGARATSDTDFAGKADDSVQVCVFVRRIDSGIRLRGVDSMAEAFGIVPPGINPLPSLDARRRVPVAVDARGRPTADGFGNVGGAANYSAIDVFQYSFPATDEMLDTEPRSVIIPDTSTALNDLRPYVAQVGQQFVDQFGVVHEVTAVRTVAPNAAGLRLVVDPPIDSRIEGWVVGRDPPNDTMRMLYTPQIPVRVVVTTIQP